MSSCALTSSSIAACPGHACAFINAFLIPSYLMHLPHAFVPSCASPHTPTHACTLIYAGLCPHPQLHALFHACTHLHMPSPCLHPHASLTATWPLSICACAHPHMPTVCTIFLCKSAGE